MALGNFLFAQLKESNIDTSAWSSDNATPKSRAIPKSKEATIVSKEETGGGAFFFVFIIFAAIIFQVYHTKITAPIEPGQVLSPGGWISKCGLAFILPSCDNAYLQMGDDGVLSLFDSHGELEWKMDGAICESDDCINGLEMKKDGKLAIGGKPIQWVNVKKNAEDISPWPFAIEPKLKVIHARN